MSPGKTAIVTTDGLLASANQLLLGENKAERLSEVQTVTCIDVNYETLNTVRYTPSGTCRERQQRVEVSVKEALTGNVLKTDVFRGGRPSRCPNTINRISVTRTGLPVQDHVIAAFVQGLTASEPEPEEDPDKPTSLYADAQQVETDGALTFVGDWAYSESLGWQVPSSGSGMLEGPGLPIVIPNGRPHSTPEGTHLYLVDAAPSFPERDRIVVARRNDDGSIAPIQTIHAAENRQFSSSIGVLPNGDVVWSHYANSGAHEFFHYARNQAGKLELDHVVDYRSDFSGEISWGSVIVSSEGDSLYVGSFFSRLAHFVQEDGRYALRSMISDSSLYGLRELELLGDERFLLARNSESDRLLTSMRHKSGSVTEFVID